MTAEDEEFNRIEMESRIRQEYVREMKKKWLVKCSICDESDCTHQVQFMSMPMMDYIDLTQKLAIARIAVRELGDRLARIEAGNMRNDVIEEVAKEIEKFTAFGQDTVQSFAVYIRGMKT